MDSRTIVQQQQMLSRVLVLATIVGSLSACGDKAPGSSPDPEGSTVTSDSAPGPREGIDLQIAAQPQVDIGGDDEGDAPPLYGVTDALRLADGRIVVANSGSSQLQFYGGSGEFLLAAGGQGGGPGEFRYIEWIRSGGADSLLVYDAGLERLSLFTADGRFVRSMRLDVPGTGAAAIPIGRFADGTFLARAPDPERLRRLATESFQDSSAYLRYTATGTPLDTVGRFVNDEVFLHMEPFGGRRMSRMYIAPPFGRKTLVYTAGNEVYVGDGGTGEIAVFSSSGDQTRVVRAVSEPRKMAAEDIQRFRERQLSRLTNDRDRREMERRLEAVPYPEVMPALGALLVDSRGWLWVADFSPPGIAPSAWTVFDASGRSLGKVTTPEGLAIYQIGADYVLGRWRDPATDLEHVRLYPLSRR